MRKITRSTTPKPESLVPEEAWAEAAAITDYELDLVHCICRSQRFLRECRPAADDLWEFFSEPANRLVQIAVKHYRETGKAITAAVLERRVDTCPAADREFVLDHFEQVQGREPDVDDVLSGLRDWCQEQVDGVAALAARSDGRSMREVTKIAQRLYALIDADGASRGRLASKIVPRTIPWLWEYYIPRHRITILTGNPNVGKSVVTTDLIARLTQARAWPDAEWKSSQKRPPRGIAVILSAEDDADDTIVPRLQHHSADLKRILVIGRGEVSAYSTALPANASLIEQRVREHQARFADERPRPPLLLVLDPLDAFMAGVNTSRNNEVREALVAIDEIAKKWRVTMLAVLHPNKNATQQAIYRLSGGLAFAGHARSVLYANYDPDDEEHGQRVLAQGKNNLGPPSPSLSFRITNPNPGRVEWMGVSDIDHERLMAPPNPKSEDARPYQDAIKFLSDVLADGPKPATEIAAHARAELISEPTLQRAKKRLGVQSRKTPGGWEWSLAGGGKVITSA